MRAVELIRKKRDGLTLDREEVKFLVTEFTRDRIPDYQMSAWLMAAVLRGLDRSELSSLTESMLWSGSLMDLSSLPGCKADKHSTGGVGDKTSLIVAPVAAAGGLIVPMISGRGLAHTGGTLDKLEAIPGFRVDLTLEEIRRFLGTCGCALAGQTAELAPADRKLYALRDVTATVDSPALICASIMSKKLAEGIDALVLDVKTGGGAFMAREEDAIHLARLMVETGTEMGTRTVALITDMSQPLGMAVGNALEVAECLEALRGGGPPDLRTLCIELAGWMFLLGGRCGTLEEGRNLAEAILDDGRGLKKFREIISLQGGDPDITEESGLLPQASHRVDIESPESGWIDEIDCRSIGTAGVLLGGGRETKEGTVDPAVGILMHKKLGDSVSRGEPLCSVHYNSEARLPEVRAMLARAFRMADISRKAPPPLLQRVIGATVPPVPTLPV